MTTPYSLKHSRNGYITVNIKLVKRSNSIINYFVVIIVINCTQALQCKAEQFDKIRCLLLFYTIWRIEVHTYTINSCLPSSVAACLALLLFDLLILLLILQTIEMQVLKQNTTISLWRWSHTLQQKVN